MNLNKVTLLGRLTADPELKTFDNNKSVANFSIATNETWKDKDGNKKQEVEFHSITVWGKPAENVKKFLKKGSQVVVEGKLKTESWEDEKGLKHKATKIIADYVQFGPSPKQSIESS